MFFYIFIFSLTLSRSERVIALRERSVRTKTYSRRSGIVILRPRRRAAVGGSTYLLEPGYLTDLSIGPTFHSPMDRDRVRYSPLVFTARASRIRRVVHVKIFLSRRLSSRVHPRRPDRHTENVIAHRCSACRLVLPTYISYVSCFHYCNEQHPSPGGYSFSSLSRDRHLTDVCMCFVIRRISCLSSFFYCVYFV